MISDVSAGICAKLYSDGFTGESWEGEPKVVSLLPVERRIKAKT